ncbi:MAG: hypothetical protein F6K65_27640, partial [Moorea sp. SIO3C2]|nr:hypothetical protein [Moorena sp. SIO3C2]
RQEAIGKSNPPDCRLPIPDSRFPIPDSRLPTPDCRLPSSAAGNLYSILAKAKNHFQSLTIRLTIPWARSPKHINSSSFA